MNKNNLTGLSSRDFKKLLRTPEKDLLGEIIRLNCNVYSNQLDVIKVSLQIQDKKTQPM
jgi:hypothetical protein